jgi:hypothetical protein
MAFRASHWDLCRTGILAVSTRDIVAYQHGISVLPCSGLPSTDLLSLRVNEIVLRRSRTIVVVIVPLPGDKFMAAPRAWIAAGSPDGHCYPQCILAWNKFWSGTERGENTWRSIDPFQLR